MLRDCGLSLISISKIRYSTKWSLPGINGSYRALEEMLVLSWCCHWHQCEVATSNHIFHPFWTPRATCILFSCCTLTPSDIFFLLCPVPLLFSYWRRRWQLSYHDLHLHTQQSTWSQPKRWNPDFLAWPRTEAMLKKSHFRIWMTLSF